MLLYAATDLINPLLACPFDFLRNKSGRIWHCRIPLSEIGEARYYGYSVSGETVAYIYSFDPNKVLIDPYATAYFFHLILIATLPREKDQMQEKPRWACCRHHA